MSSYEKTLKFLFEQLPMYQRQGKKAFKKDLTNIRKLCEYIHNPQNSIKCIHVAGTNGKGSTVHILSSILQQAGYRVGVYTSPHYADFRERIKINKEYIPQSFVTQFVQQNSEVLREIKPSFFEITVAMAFQYFASQKIDIALIETGLGGRLDSTNILSPILSIITNIGLDHMDMLGNTLPAIAYEKAGIIKPNTPILIGQDHRDTSSVFRQKSLAVNAPLFFANRWVDVQIEQQSITSNTLQVSFLFDKTTTEYTFETDLTAEYQIANIRTSLASVMHIRRYGFYISEDHIKKGLHAVKSTSGMIGRWDVRQVDPLVVFDSAHNEDGLKQLIQQLRSYHKDQLHFVYGTVDDKELERILALLPIDAQYYLCKADIPRGKNVEQLADDFKARSLQCTSYESVKNAYKAALENASKKDVIVVAGSIFVVAELV